jgi:hypothetical protein
MMGDEYVGERPAALAQGAGNCIGIGGIDGGGLSGGGIVQQNRIIVGKDGKLKDFEPGHGYLLSGGLIEWRALQVHN